MGACIDCYVSNSIFFGSIRSSGGNAGGAIGTCVGGHCVAKNTIIGSNTNIVAENGGNAGGAIGSCEDAEKCTATGTKVGYSFGNDHSDSGDGNLSNVRSSGGNAGGAIGMCAGGHCVAKNTIIGSNTNIVTENGGNASGAIGSCEDAEKCTAIGTIIGYNFGSDHCGSGDGSSGGGGGSHGGTTSTTSHGM